MNTFGGFPGLMNQQGDEAEQKKKTLLNQEPQSQKVLRPVI